MSTTVEFEAGGYKTKVEMDDEGKIHIGISDYVVTYSKQEWSELSERIALAIDFLSAQAVKEGRS